MPLAIIDRNLQFTGPFALRSKTDTLVLHHAAAMSCTVEDVHRWHLGNGWLGIGYHYLVSKLGGIYRGRPENVWGAHAEGHNDHTIGICAEGDYDKETVMPIPQKQAIIALIQDISTRYPGPKIVGHRDLNATLCPGQHYPFDEIVSAATGTPIAGPAKIHYEDAQAWAKDRKAAQDFVDLAPVYWAEAARRGIQPEVAYAQSAKETAFGRFGGTVPRSHNNWCGLKTRDGGANNDPDAHARFVDDRTGVIAHIQHLCAYAGVALDEDIVDPRYVWVAQGSAKTVEELGGKWAPSPEYGLSIRDDYLVPMLGYAGREPVADEPDRPEDSPTEGLESTMLADLEERVAKLENILSEIKSVLKDT